MYPYLFGQEWLPMYGIMMAIGMLAAVLLFKIICDKKKVDDKTYNFYSLLAIVSIGVGLLGAFFFQAVYDWVENGFNHFSLFGSGLTFMGGLIGGVLTFVFGTLFFAKGQVKRNFFTTASYAAPSIAVGHALGRFGCVFAGCCYGKPTHSHLGLDFPDLKHYGEYAATGGRAYPTQLYEALFLVLLATVLLVLLFRFKKHMVLLPLYGFAYSVFRFLIEFLRGDERGAFLLGLSPSQWQSIALFIVASVLTLLIFRFKIIPFAKTPLPPPPDSVVPPLQPILTKSTDNPDATKNMDTTDNSEATKKSESDSK